MVFQEGKKQKNLENFFVTKKKKQFLMEYRIHFLFTYSSFLINIHST